MCPEFRVNRRRTTCPELIVKRKIAQHGKVSKGACTSVKPVSCLKLHLLSKHVALKKLKRSSCPSPRLCLGTVIVLTMPLTSTLSWYCHRPCHAPHLDSVLVLSSSLPPPEPLVKIIFKTVWIISHTQLSPRPPGLFNLYLCMFKLFEFKIRHALLNQADLGRTQWNQEGNLGHAPFNQEGNFGARPI